MNKQTTFTRKEIVNNAINEIRLHIHCYKKYGNIRHIEIATNIAMTLGHIDIIKMDKSILLARIINNMALKTD